MRVGSSEVIQNRDACRSACTWQTSAAAAYNEIQDGVTLSPGRHTVADSTTSRMAIRLVLESPARCQQLNASRSGKLSRVSISSFTRACSLPA